MSQTTLDTAGNIIGYVQEGNSIYRYDSVTQVSSLWKILPADYLTTIRSDIASAPNRIDPTYGSPADLGDAPIRILSDNRILVPYVFGYSVNVSTAARKFVYNYLLYSYDAGSLTLLGRTSAYMTEPSMGGLPGFRYYLPDVASYQLADGTMYVYFQGMVYDTVG